MPRVIRNTLLNYTPQDFFIENIINPARIFNFNNCEIKQGSIVYLCEREIRTKDNFALQFALQKSQELDLDLKIIHPKINYEYKPKQDFIDKQIKQVSTIFSKYKIDFQTINKSPYEILKELDIAFLIIDFNPILNRNYLKNFRFKILEIDGHNIIPAKLVSNKQEYNASTLRKKIYYNIYPFLTEYKNLFLEDVEADNVLKDFIINKLPYYDELRNYPTKNVLSNLSKYLNLGFISSQRVAIEIIKSNAQNINKEAFLEELIIRKELADNFCLYSQGFKDFSSIPNWARISLENHKYDIRPHLYSLKELENALSEDSIWNLSQNQLKNEGKIHSYLRMYWAKKILEWTNSPEKALKFAIYLNDKYAFDSPSANGYVGILWSIAGLHDRAFADHPVTGKIRRMSYNSLRKKYNL